ncbi:hypothetical protein HPB51_025731 [Rhipicephalus microplus]|uniref:PiggyBac transposable element-derived protein domain-containing protein n=1 Tax=Rhipicephalus microplus TaxID=6941 RepID=A0A9J6FA82_RHIMP|nr:hypothetical protein HPB51_025731 [Rhipicephalus microplus]
MTLRNLRCLSPNAREEESSGSELRCLAMKWPQVIQPGEISMLMDEYTVFQLDALESAENIDEYWRAAFDLKKCDGTTKYPLLGIFNPENDDDMEEIMKMLESSDIECSSDDDDPDWELPERHVAAADDKEEQSQEDLDDAANTIAQTSACATQSAPSGKYIWKEEPFEEKSLPSFEYDLSEPPGNVRTPLEYFFEYFDDSFFQNAAEKTNMYCMSTTGEILKATPQKIRQLFGMHIIMGCIRLPNIHMYWRRGYQVDQATNVMLHEEFKTLRSCLHFVDTQMPPNKPEENRLWKVQPIIDAVRKRCHKLDRAPVSYSIDEQIIPFTGRCSLRQYVKGKPRPLGLKNFVLTTSAGLVMDFEVYQGKSTPLSDTALGLGPNVVLRPVETLPKHSSVYFDRYFTTIPLLDALIDKEIDATGTIMTNRVKNIHFQSDTMMKQGDFQEFRRADGKAAIVK